MQLKSLKNRAKQILYFLTGGLFVLSASVMINGTAQQYTQLARERSALLNTPDLEKETRNQLKAVKADLAGAKQRLAQYRSPQPGVLVPAFIQYLGMLAKDEGVTISTISPGPQQAGPVSMIKTPFKIDMAGKFASLHRFITRLEKSMLPVRIEEVVMTAGEDKNLDLSLSCYILSEKAVRQKRMAEGPLRAVFASLPYRSIEQALDIKRDIFVPTPVKLAPVTLVKKKKIKKIAKKKKRRKPFGKTTLSAIIYDGQNSVALLNGVALSVGDLYKGYTVKSIGKDRIRLVNLNNNHQIVVREN